MAKLRSARKARAQRARLKGVAKKAVAPSRKLKTAAKATRAVPRKVTRKVPVPAPVEPKGASPELKKAALVAVRDCLAVKSGEQVLVITDEPKRTIGYALWEAAKELGAEAFLTEMLPRSSHGEEPPAPIAQLMGLVNVVLCPTTRSLTHTNARREASKKGVRIATLPGITEDMMIRTLSADYQRVAELSRKLAEILDAAQVIRVVSEKGTDITLPKSGRKAMADTGLYHNPGEMGNLPAGEAFLAPLEGQSNGVIVVDGAMAGVGIVKKPIRIVVENGYATEITGGPEADALKALMEPHGRDAFNVAEFGMGTNYKAKLTGQILEDEKVLGTVHIAFGDNVSMGGTVSVASHLDGLIKKPTVYVDDRMIMEKGKLLV
jgi:leucyl aminopeptidase (aminopeptidase T)